MFEIAMNKVHGENTSQSFDISWQHAILIHAIAEVFVHHENGPTNGKEEQGNKDGVQDFGPI